MRAMLTRVCLAVALIVGTLASATVNLPAQQWGDGPCMRCSPLGPCVNTSGDGVTQCSMCPSDNCAVV